MMIIVAIIGVVGLAKAARSGVTYKQCPKTPCPTNTWMAKAWAGYVWVAESSCCGTEMLFSLVFFFLFFLFYKYIPFFY